MKRVASILLVLLTLFVLPMAALADEHEPFLFRGRYTWGMPLEEVKQQAAQEGLTFENEYPNSVIYQNVPVAGVFAKQLKFSYVPEVGLDYISYLLADDPEESLALYPLFLEQLTFLYGEPDQLDSEEYIARWQRYDVYIIFRGNFDDKGCFLTYMLIDPKPTPIPLTTDGL